MPPKCSICTHPQRNNIDRVLAGPDSLRAIARQFGTTSSALDRHRRRHLVPELARSLARHEEMTAERIASWLVGLNEQTLAAVLRCAQESDFATMRGLIGESRKNLELLGRFGGFLEPLPVHIDARQQTAVLAAMSEDELRALARSAIDEQRELPAAAHMRG